MFEEADSVEIDPIMYWGANRKPMAASSKKVVSAIFLLPVWRETAAGRRFSPFFAIIVRVIASAEC